MSFTPPPRRATGRTESPEPARADSDDDRSSRERSLRASALPTPVARQQQQQHNLDMPQSNQQARSMMLGAHAGGMQPPNQNLPQFAHEQPPDVYRHPFPYTMNNPHMMNSPHMMNMMSMHMNMNPHIDPSTGLPWNAPTGVFRNPEPAHSRRSSHTGPLPPPGFDEHGSVEHVSTDEELRASGRPTSFQKNDFELRDPKAAPPSPPEGKGFMNEAKMFKSDCLSKGTPIFLEDARWAMSEEGIAIEVYNFNSKVYFSPGEVRQSISALITILGFEDECILRALPVSKSGTGPWHIVIAAQAAEVLMNNEDQISIMPYDTDDGRAEGAVQVRVLTPHGKPYPGAEERPKMRTRDTSYRISCFLDLPISEQMLEDGERNAMRKIYERAIAEHFARYGGEGVGFIVPYNEDGDLEPKLTVFVNHPKDMSRKDFIRQAFPEIKYYDIGVSEPAKFKLRKEDVAIAGIQMCCFLTKCAPNPRLPGHHCAARMNLAAGMSEHGPTRPPVVRLPNPKKDAGPSEQHRERKRKHTEETAAKFANRACRAHEHGRCVYAASECSAVHFADSDTIDCNSSIKEGDVRYTNKKFGICRNFLIDRACPYAKCEHAPGPVVGGEQAPPPSPAGAADADVADADMT